MGRKAGVSKYPTPEAKRAARIEQARRSREKLKAEHPEVYAARVKKTQEKIEKRMEDPEYRDAVYAKRRQRNQERRSDPNYVQHRNEYSKGISAKRRKSGKTQYTNDHTLVENYETALSDEFDSKKWICHHKLENYYRSETLMANKMYYYVPAEQLRWVNKDEHSTDSSMSVSSPLDSKWHKAVFDLIRDTLKLNDREKLPKEFDNLVKDVDKHYWDYLTVEYLGQENLTNFMEVYHQIEELTKLLRHYYMAMILVETGKKKIW